MVTQYKLKPKPKLVAKAIPEFHHLTCCDDDISMCGQDVRMLPYTDAAGEQRCIVCYDMLECDTPCQANCDF
jgi:hypothetical protein